MWCDVMWCDVLCRVVAHSSTKNLKRMAVVSPRNMYWSQSPMVSLPLGITCHIYSMSIKINPYILVYFGIPLQVLITLLMWYHLKSHPARNDVKSLMEKHKGNEVILFKKDSTAKVPTCLFWVVSGLGQDCRFGRGEICFKMLKEI